MIEKLLDPLLSPWRALRSKIFEAKMLPDRVRGEAGRARGQFEEARSDVRGYGQGVKEMGGRARSGGGSAAMATNPARPKMGLFSRKRKCPGCVKKINASWQECPYCGWGRGSAGAGGGRNRTVAIDTAASGGAVDPQGLGWLVPTGGRRLGDLFEVRGRVTIGSASDNDIVVDEPSISGHHAELVAVAGGFRLSDLGSTNGTFVNDKRVATYDLVDNDNVRLGQVPFKFKSLT